MLGEKDAEGIMQTYAKIHDKYNDSNLFILDDDICWNDKFAEYQKGALFKTRDTTVDALELSSVVRGLSLS
jgi:hypothetical protein